MTGGRKGDRGDLREREKETEGREAKRDEKARERTASLCVTLFS